MGRTEEPNLKNDYERACGWYGHFNKSEMALFSECTGRYAQNLLDTADIVREAIFRQSSRSGTVYLLNVISHLIVDRFLMSRVVSPNSLAAMLLQEGHTVLMPSRSRQLGRALSSAITSAPLDTRN